MICVLIEELIFLDGNFGIATRVFTIGRWSAFTVGPQVVAHLVANVEGAVVTAIGRVLRHDAVVVGLVGLAIAFAVPGALATCHDLAIKFMVYREFFMKIVETPIVEHIL